LPYAANCCGCRDFAVILKLAAETACRNGKAMADRRQYKNGLAVAAVKMDCGNPALNVPHDVPLGLGQGDSDIVPVCLKLRA